MLKDEPRLTPPDYEDETLAKEIWVANRALELRSDKELMPSAIDWHLENHDNGVFSAVLAGWFAWEQTDGGMFAAKRVQATTRLHGILVAIAESYCEEVLYPEMKEKVKRGY